MCVHHRHEFPRPASAHCRTIARLAAFLTIRRGIADKNQQGGIPTDAAGGQALAGAGPPMSPEKDGARDWKRPWQALGRWLESASLC